MKSPFAAAVTRFCLVVVCFAFAGLYLFAGNGRGSSPNPPEKSAEKSGASEQARKFWIFFRDKGPQALAKKSSLLQAAAANLTPAALERRAKVLPKAALVDESDIDIYQGYLDELARYGLEPVAHSRWLNAVSAIVEPEQIPVVEQLPFVKEIRPVARLRIPPNETFSSGPDRNLTKPDVSHRLDYGQSLSQVAQIRATDLHDAGINGRGVLVGMFDSGFRWQEHEAFEHLRVIAEHDFVKDDEVTRNEAGDVASQDNHGTQTLSTIAGFKEGELIGPAFAAEFILAKTEDIPTETHAEEDFWVEAMEWMEGMGVEVTSTSLGYSTFDAGQTSYTPADMDGATTIITRAAEMAAGKGVIVVSSAGNEGDNSWRIITAPADGPNVIAVGAVWSDGRLANDSSRGPTADGRIKPDVVAMGVGVRAVSSGKIEYQFVKGTSFSCPLTAGVVAQILSAHPEVTPQQMMQALHSTASMADSANNDYGYGIVNARAAITWFGPAFSNVPEVDASLSNALNITIRILSRDGLVPGSVQLSYSSGGGFNTLVMSPVDSITYSAGIPRPSLTTDTVQVYFSATDVSFGTVRHPPAAPQEVFRIRGDGTVLGNEPPRALPKDFTLVQNRPNPFGSINAPETRLLIDLPRASQLRIRIYNVLGQRVRDLFDGQLEAGRYNYPRSLGGIQESRLMWDGTDDDGRSLASGVYFYEAMTPAWHARGRLVLLR